jgi:putative oxidoreductase
MIEHMKYAKNLPKLDDFEVYRPSPGARVADDSAADTLTRKQWVASWVCRAIAAAIMIETLFFKFTAAPESVYIFSKMGTEPWWRYGQGIWELLAAVFLLLPRHGWIGGPLTVAAMSAAIVSHLTWLGIGVQGDHGLLFGMAIVTFVCGFTVLMLHRRENPYYVSMTSW